MNFCSDMALPALVGAPARPWAAKPDNVTRGGGRVDGDTGATAAPGGQPKKCRIRKPAELGGAVRTPKSGRPGVLRPASAPEPPNPSAGAPPGPPRGGRQKGPPTGTL